MTNVYGLATLSVAQRFASELRELEAAFAVNLYVREGEIRFELLADETAPDFALGDQADEAYDRGLGIVPRISVK